MSLYNEPIAIIGTGCRFPGNATTTAKLWELLSQPGDLSTEIPLSRFNSTGFYHPDGSHHGTSNVQKSYFLEEDVRQFDSQFFNISTAEAESMDPQQRKLLEVVFEAIESANLTMEQLRGTPTAVYVGLMCDDYSGLIFSDMESVPTYGATGAARSILSNRISYFFDWTGPSMTIDSACSSSLVAVHQAVQTLRNGECSVALAAGANLILSPRMFIAESKLKMLSPNGRCRMWDEGGDGYARGEGIAAVVLKRLSDAIADGDHIECVIRETHVNQGGRSTGLTVPNPVAQVSLIRQTYAKAGLDLNCQADRPQYFQAHGTGTKVGDLNETTAIHNVFFSSPEESRLNNLYVGSIKTVIGHSEGAAGLAGLLEASLAVQHGVIPPNLHFETLNPKLEQFYQNLEVPTRAMQWPNTTGGPRRASVNSFGFGGTNAHVILENYSPLNGADMRQSNITSSVALPLTFSAASERSLASLLSSYSNYLKANPDVDLNTLAWTLLCRKSIFTHKISFAAATATSLCSKIDMELELKEKATSRIVASRPTSKPKRILGVFTGQGSQWAAMGAELIAASSLARETVHVLEETLATLPLEHRPNWSLSVELSAPSSTSRITEAAISQPLCTAIQIVLVEHLRLAGVRFSAIVGHSSGEIAAAYAAGFITADAAIKIAYYRGFYAKLAGAGKLGSMLAVGTSMAEGEELCQSPAFKDRLVVAASNSTTSITISGDADAISEAKAYFDGKDIFTRLLKVDTAYHSHHMTPCADPYLQSLMDCDIQIQQPSTNNCIWYSSVNDGEQMEAYESLKGTYWRDNMLKPVLFSQALTQSAVTGSYDFVLEVGPHPALKGPASQTLSECSGAKKNVPYSGLLARGQSGIESFADALGSLWTHFGSTSFDAEAYNRLFNENTTRFPLKGLPTYPWDHERTLWYESRGSRETRLRQDPPHELLGIQTTDKAEGEYRWRNYLRLNELPWLNGHQIQGQTIFPAAGYVAMALEASKTIAGSRSICLIEIQDLKIQQSISIKDDTSGVEVLFVAKELSSKAQREALDVEFACHACLNKDTGSFVLVTSGQMTIHFGKQSSNILPGRPQKQISDLRVVDVESFYDSLDEVGYGYTGLFRGISFLQQKIDISTGLITNASYNNPESTLMMHPGTMDAAIQSLFACLGTPGDGSLWTLHVPVSIRNIRFNPFSYSNSGCSGGQDIIFDASLEGSPSEALCGSINLYDSEGQSTLMQLEGIEVKPLMPATEADDRLLFHELVWGSADPDAALVYRKTPFSEAEIRKAETLEMICLYYLQQLDNSVKPEDREACDWHGKRILNYASHVLDETRAGQHPSCKPEWLLHSQDEICKIGDEYDTDIDCRLIHTVGSKLIPFIRGDDTILEHMRKDGLLDSYYQNSELLEYNEYAGLIAAQVAFRYPLMKVLEIGGGTGGATRAILKHLDNKYSSYSFTDISVGFFEQAQETFKGHRNIIYESLDIEKDPTNQGFQEHSYDLVIASNVLHATKFLDQTMANVRKLLKPGGKLLILEAVDNGAIRVGFSFCGVPGWWAGADDGRELSPLITPGQWNSLLLRNGFSGIDTITPGTESTHQPVAVFVSSAVDEQIDLLQKPLSYAGSKAKVETLLIVGGKTDHTKQLVQDLKLLFQPWTENILSKDALEGLDLTTASSMMHVLNLSELDAPVFDDLTSSRLEAFKSLLNISKSFLWVTAGSKSDSSYSSMALGIGRTLVHEMPHLRLQVLDAAHASELSAPLLAEAFLRIILAETWKNDIYAPERLWSNEPELWLENGRLNITRVVPEKAANRRLMSSRRVIEEEIDVQKFGIDVTWSGESYALNERGSPEEFPGMKADEVSILVSHSTLSALRVKGAGYLYLVLGENYENSTKVLALSASNGSFITTPACWTLQWHVKEGEESLLIISIANDLLSQVLIDTALDNSTLLLFQPELALAEAVQRRAPLKNIKPCFLTSAVETKAENWLHLPQFSSDQEMKAKVPKDISALVDFSPIGKSSDLVSRIGAIVPPLCQKATSSMLFSRTSQRHPGISLYSVADSLRSAVANSVSILYKTPYPNHPSAIPARQLSEPTPVDLGLQILDWTASPTVPVRVQSAESLVRFKNDKTYLLVGMAGDMGRSLCRWMILHGAKHVVLTSRNPSIEKRWLDDMQELGGMVKVMSMDISDRDSLSATIKTISETLPPIAGVANAAMVLSDTLLTNMTFEEMQKVLKPKVDGSRFLDSLFPNNTLDFFILFGSSVDIMGNSGQSAYCAANMFMNSLVHSRRKRGLAGSLIGLGEVKGVGYAARMNRQLNDIIGATLPLSEREVHHMFAEGVFAGRAGSERNPVLYAGMDSKDPKKEPDILWYPHPKFWHYIESGDGVATGADKGKVVVSLKSQLKEVKSKDEVLDIVKDAFIIKLHHKLQVASETAISQDAVLLELGIDSLVAVDLRAWFVTEVGVDMPILKILGGASIIELVSDAVGRLPQTLLPAAAAAESEPKSTPGVLVPNGLGGLDLVVKSTETQPAATLSSESPKDKDDSVPIPPPPQPAPTPPTPTPAPETQQPVRGHFKHPSTASSVPSSDFQGPFSQSYTPVFSDISSHSQPDPEAVMNLLNSSLDAVAESTDAEDVGSGGAVMTPTHSEDAEQE